MTALLLQIELIDKRLEIFGAFGVCLLFLTIAIFYLARKVDRLEAENKILAEKAIEGLTMATSVIDVSQDQGKELKAAMESLRVDVLTRSCKYEKH